MKLKIEVESVNIEDLEVQLGYVAEFLGNNYASDLDNQEFNNGFGNVTFKLQND